MGQTDMQKQMDRLAYTNYCKEFKLKPEWLDQAVTDRGKTYTIVGLNIRSKKFPVITKEGIRFNADYVRGLMTGDMATIEKEREQKREKEYQQARKDYPTWCRYHGLDESWLDKTFVFRFFTYRIEGLLTNRRTKYPVVARRTNGEGKIQLFQADHVAELMKKAAAEAVAAKLRLN
jgi:hypothetical protein